MNLRAKIIISACKARLESRHAVCEMGGAEPRQPVRIACGVESPEFDCHRAGISRPLEEGYHTVVKVAIRIAKDRAPFVQPRFDFPLAIRYFTPNDLFREPRQERVAAAVRLDIEAAPMQMLDFPPRHHFKPRNRLLLFPPAQAADKVGGDEYGGRKSVSFKNRERRLEVVPKAVIERQDGRSVASPGVG